MHTSILSALLRPSHFVVPQSQPVPAIPKITVEMRFTSREESLEYMISNGNRNDPKNCTIITGDGENSRTFVVNRELLRASSFFFPMNILDQPQAFNIHYLDINSDIFFTLLKHISLQSEWKFDGSVSEAKLLLETACKFQLDDFVHHMYTELVPKHSLEGIGFLSVRTACEIYEATRYVTGAKEFNTAAFEFILRNAMKVFQDNSFVKLSTAAVAEILSRDDISVHSEVDIFDAMLRWHHTDEDAYLIGTSTKTRNLRKCIKESVLNCIRFPNFEPFVYCGLIQRWRILSKDEEDYLYSIWAGTSESETNERLKSRPFLKNSPRTYIKRPASTQNVLRLRSADLKATPSNNSDLLKMDYSKVEFKMNQKQIETQTQQAADSDKEWNTLRKDFFQILKEAKEILNEIRKEIQVLQNLKAQAPKTPENPKSVKARSNTDGWGTFGDGTICNWSLAD